MKGETGNKRKEAFSKALKGGEIVVKPFINHLATGFPCHCAGAGQTPQKDKKP